MATELPQSPNYSRNIDRVRAGQTPCAVCGKGIDGARARHYLHIVGGGVLVATEAEIAAGRARGDEDYDPAGDLYFYPVGADCLGRHPELRPYAQTMVEEDHDEPTVSVPGFGSVKL